METKSALNYNEQSVMYIDDNRSYRIEKMLGGFLGVMLSAVGLILAIRFYAGKDFYIMLISVFASALILLSVLQIVFSFILAGYPHECIIDYDRIILREKRLYHYIEFSALGEVRVKCKNLVTVHKGSGYECIDIIDGEVYYFIGEIKKKLATKSADKIAFIITHRLLNEEFNDWGAVYENGTKNYKKIVYG